MDRFALFEHTIWVNIDEVSYVQQAGGFSEIGLKGTNDVLTVALEAADVMSILRRTHINSL